MATHWRFTSYDVGGLVAIAHRNHTVGRFALSLSLVLSHQIYVIRFFETQSITHPHLRFVFIRFYTRLASPRARRSIKLSLTRRILSGQKSREPRKVLTPRAQKSDAKTKRNSIWFRFRCGVFFLSVVKAEQTLSKRFATHLVDVEELSPKSLAGFVFFFALVFLV